MARWVLFQADAPLDFAALRELMEGSLDEEGEWEIHSDRSGCFCTGGPLKDRLEVLLPMINNDLGCTLSMLLTHHPDALSWACLRLVSRRRGGRCTMLADAVILGYLDQDEEIKRCFDVYFERIPFPALKTAEALIQTGQNASRAAAKLYVHRNTFQYRLRHFIELSGLDIRDPDNAHLFYFYMLIKEK